MKTTTQDKPAAAAIATDPNAAARSAPRAGSKIGKVIALLERGEGATLDVLVKATGWQAHTARAALTGLKKRGYDIERTKRDDVSVYAIVTKS